MADKSKVLYDRLAAENYRLPDYDTFSKVLQDKGKREEFYNRLRRTHSVPDFETFDYHIGSRPMTFGENVKRLGKEVVETVVNIPKIAQKGFASGQAASELNKADPNAAVIAQNMKAAQPTGQTATERRAAAGAEGILPAGFKENPVSWLIETMAKSVSATLPEILDKAPAHVLAGMGTGAAVGSAGLGVGAVPGAITGAGMAVPTLMYNSSAVQRQAEYMFGALKDRGVDVTNQQAVERALSDKKLIAELKAKAAPGAVTQGFFDGLSVLGAGKIAAPVAKKLGGGVVGKVAGEAGEYVAQATAGMAGEAGAQVAEKGKVTDVQAVMAEGLAEAPAQAVATRAGKYVAGKVSKALRFNGRTGSLPNYQKMDPDFRSKFDQMADEYYDRTGKTIQVNSAFRSDAEQAAVQPTGGAPKAKPGKSRHQRGLAIDINSATSTELERMGLLKKYGFENLARINDPQHVQFSGKPPAGANIVVDTKAVGQQALDMLPDEVRQQFEADQVALAPEPAPVEPTAIETMQADFVEPAKQEAGEPIGKAYWDMTGEQLFEEVDAAQAYGKQLEVELFGQEGAKEYARLLRAENSANDVIASEASAKRQAMEDALPQKQQDRLFGANDPMAPADAETVRAFLDAVQYAEEEDPVPTLAKAMLTLQGKTDPATMSINEQIAFAQVNAIRGRIERSGVEAEGIIKAAIGQAATRFSDPEDAVMMLEPYLKLFGQEKPAAPALSAPQGTESTAPEVPDGQPGQKLGKPGASTYQQEGELKAKQFEEHAGLEGRTAQIEKETGVKPRSRTPFYEVITNRTTIEEAKNIAVNYTTDELIEAIKDKGSTIRPHVRVALAELVIKGLSEDYKVSKDDSILDQQNDLLDWTMDYAEETGRTLQAFSLYKAMTPEGVLRTFKRVVKKAEDGHYDKHRPDVDEILDAVNDKEKTPKQKKEKLDDLAKFLGKNASGNRLARQVKPLYDKIIQAAQLGALSKEEFYNIVRARLQLPEYDKDIAARIIELSQKVVDAKEGLVKDRAIAALNKYLAAQTKFSLIHLPLGIFYGNILSGISTSLVNVVDTFTNVQSEVFTMAVANPKAAMLIYSRMLKGFNEGKYDAILAWTEGRQTSDGKWFEGTRFMDVAEFGKKGGVPLRAKSPVSRTAKWLTETKLGTPLNAWKYVTRVLAAQDAFMWRAASEAKAAQLAYKMAVDGGAKTHWDAIEKAKDILALNDDQALRRQAASEGFTSKHDIHARMLEIRATLRPTDMSEYVAGFAGEATYNHKPKGVLGFAAKEVARVTTQAPALKFIIPFTQIVANVTNRSLNWTPYGFKRAYFGYGYGDVGRSTLSVDERRSMLFRASLGTTALVIATLGSGAGGYTIHGNGPDDTEKRRQMLSSGWKPYSIEYNGKYYNYLMTPLGLGFSVIGNALDMQKYGSSMDEDDPWTRAIFSVLRVGSTIFSQSFLSSVSGLFEALSATNPGLGMAQLQAFSSRTAGGLTTPNIVRDIQKMFDPQVYTSESFWVSLLKNTPVAALVMKPMINALGEPVTQKGNRFVTEKSDDPVWRMVVDKGIRISVPSTTTEIDTANDIRMSPDQYYRYHQWQGADLKQHILDNLSRYEAMDGPEIEDDINDWAKENRKSILKSIRAEYQRNGDW